VSGQVNRVTIEADGGSRGNPGPAGSGAVVRDADSGAVLAECSEFIGTATNNVAEYRGLIAGLRAARDLGARSVAVRMDSKLVVEQMKGTWQVKNDALRDLAREAISVRSGFDEISFTWIPREQNRYADRLANEAMDRRASAPVRLPGASVAEDEPATGSWAPPQDKPTRLVLVRHGETEHSVAKRFSGRNELPLSATGERQAKAVAVDLGERGLTVDGLVCSPLRRAVQTAEAIGSTLGVAIGQEVGFAEVDFGRWEGMTFAEARADDPAAFDAWLKSDRAAPPGGESFEVLTRRVRRARDGVIARFAGQTVVVVTHVSPIKTLIRLALDAPPAALFRMHLDLASVSIVDYFADGNSSVRQVNETAHLRALPGSD
jgi:probable phosphoglycerate mutase